MVNGIELTVSDALITDSGRGFARLDSKSRKALDVTSGDVIEIKGKNIFDMRSVVLLEFERRPHAGSSVRDA